MGSGADKRNRALAMRCYMLSKEQGLTHRQIAALVEKRPEQIKALIELGERVRDASIDSTTTEKRNEQRCPPENTELVFRSARR
jgi:hypothetical protein